VLSRHTLYPARCARTQKSALPRPAARCREPHRSRPGRPLRGARPPHMRSASCRKRALDRCLPCPPASAQRRTRGYPLSVTQRPYRRRLLVSIICKAQGEALGARSIWQCSADATYALLRTVPTVCKRRGPRQAWNSLSPSLPSCGPSELGVRRFCGHLTSSLR